jgi:heat shock protein HslJ
MRRIGAAVLLTMLALPAAAQNFPLEKSFKVISISGYDVQKIGMTLKVMRQGDRLLASGHAGCNSWTATAAIRDEQIDLTEIGTTKKFCGAPRMKSEEAFLTSLRSAHRWRIDDKGRLILEGDAARLLLTAGAPEAPADKKPAKK